MTERSPRPGASRRRSASGGAGRRALAGSFAAALGLGALAWAAAAAAQSRLVDQTVFGWKRICSYEEAGPVRSGRREPRRYALEIGRGEPCPFRYTRPTERPAPAGRPPSPGDPRSPGPAAPAGSAAPPR